MLQMQDLLTMTVLFIVFKYGHTYLNFYSIFAMGYQVVSCILMSPKISVLCIPGE